MADLIALREAITEGDQGRAVSLTKEALVKGVDAAAILSDGLIAGMAVIGVRFRNNEVYIPEVLVASRAMKLAMEVLDPVLAKTNSRPAGKVLIGTVQGDLHDIGRKLVAMMLRGAGFEVIDLGVDVSAETFVERARSTDAQIVGMSALLTTTMPAMEKVVKALKDSGCRARTMVGGAPVTQAYAERIGADVYGEDAIHAVDLAKALLK
jgi:5-methyltetrahydrofolate--homocysteine methyltransferase